MKLHLSLLLALCLLALAAPALAAPAPACEKLGSRKHAEHLMKHIYAYTDGWIGEGPSACTDSGCVEYGHVHCYGRRVRLWDTPAGGSSRVEYYPFGFDGRVGPDTEFQLVDIVTYKNKYFANVRVLNDEGFAVNSGFINADYVGCDCENENWEAREDVPEYIHDHGPFSLK